MAGQDVGQLIVTRNMQAYYAPYDPDNDLPADTILYGADWADNWLNAGFTDGGFGYTIDRTLESIKVDQRIDPVMRPISARDVHFDTKLAQIDSTFLKVSSGMGAVVTVAASSTLRGHEDFVLEVDVPEEVSYSFGFEAEQRNGEAFRAMIYRGTPTSSPNPTFGKADTLSSYDLAMTATPGDAGATHPLAIFRLITPITA